MFTLPSPTTPSINTLITKKNQEEAKLLPGCSDVDYVTDNIYNAFGHHSSTTKLRMSCFAFVGQYTLEGGWDKAEAFATRDKELASCICGTEVTVAGVVQPHAIFLPFFLLRGVGEEKALLKGSSTVFLINDNSLQLENLDLQVISSDRCSLLIPSIRSFLKVQDCSLSIKAKNYNASDIPLLLRGRSTIVENSNIFACDPHTSVIDLGKTIRSDGGYLW